MVAAHDNEFYRRIGYQFERFDPAGYENVVRFAEPLYRADPAYWKGLLAREIDAMAAHSRALRIPLATTECWSIIDYKDWPLLSWDWVKEVCAEGTRRAASTGRWAALATSNFCGPQFAGMWRDAALHQELTTCIKSAPLPSAG